MFKHLLENKKKMNRINKVDKTEKEKFNYEYYKKKVESKKFYIKYIKRPMDIIITSVLIILALPIFIITAIAIKLTSKGPVFFIQERIGYKGKMFKCYKFRSMYIEHQQPDSNHSNPEHYTKKGILMKHKNDPRVTSVGKIIRKTSIDELPQLFNVIKGDMSLVGPRPVLEFFQRPVPEFSKIRTLVPQGLTGYWQVKNRANSSSIYHMVDFDLYYLEHISPLLDLKILFETVSAVIKAKGAY